MLRTNEALTSLQLSMNMVGPEAACAIAEALSTDRDGGTPCQLRELDLTMCNLGEEGKGALARAAEAIPGLQVIAHTGPGFG